MQWDQIFLLASDHSGHVKAVVHCSHDRNCTYLPLDFDVVCPVSPVLSCTFLVPFC